METSDLINETNRKLNGEYEVVVKDSSTWNTILSTLNENIDSLQKIKGVYWRTTYDPMFKIGVVGDSQFYKLDFINEISSISGSERASVKFYLNGVIQDSYKIVPQDIFDLAGDNDKVATINMKGVQLKPKTNTDTIYGCDIILPVFTRIKKLARATDKPNVDDPYWLIDKSASDLASVSPVDFISRNADKYEKQAEVRLRAMIKNNGISQSPITAIGSWRPSDRPDGQ